MRIVKGYGLVLLALSAIVFGMQSCTGSKEVGRSVDEINEAMVRPALDQPAFLDQFGQRGASDAWRDPFDRIEQLILQNANQEVLVNQLRVRQAMLLTVYEQGNLAAEKWEQVEEDALRTERDIGLYQNRDCLLWWYKRAPSAVPLDMDEKNRANTCIETLTGSIGSIQETDIRFYIGTIRAQMDLKLANDADVSTPALQTMLSGEMAQDLERYIALFSPEDHTWVQNNSTIGPGEDIDSADLRRRSGLSGMIKSFRNVAENLEIAPAWIPAWVGTLEFE